MLPPPMKVNQPLSATNASPKTATAYAMSAKNPSNWDRASPELAKNASTTSTRLATKATTPTNTDTFVVIAHQNKA